MRDCLEVAELTDYDATLSAEMEKVRQIVSNIRTVRNQKNIPLKDQLELHCIGANNFEKYACVISKMANLKDIKVVSEKDASAASFMVGTDEFAVPLGNMIDVKAEIERLEAQLKHLEGFLNGVNKKLANEKFVANAPEAVVAMERKKKKDSEEKIAAIKESLKALK